MALLSSIANDTGTGTTTSSPTTTTYSALRQGSTGTSVKTLQTALANQGYYTGAIDGSYGPMTLAAVKAYQTKMGLTVDGIAGSQTQGSLYTLPKTVAPTTTAPGTPLPEDINRMNAPVVSPTSTQVGVVPGSTIPTQSESLFSDSGLSTVHMTSSGDVAGGAGRSFSTSNLTPSGTPLPEDIARMQGYTTPSQTAPVDSRTAGLGEAAEEAKQKTLDAMQQQEQAERDTISNIVKTTTGTGSGGGTGTSGTTLTGGGTTTGKTPTTGGTSTGTGTGTPSATGNWQEYFKKATETDFSYNPAQDNEYRLAASLIEQQVTDMMVGRGGLYSSVAHAALQSRLMTLQVDYQKMAYEKFKEERDFNMQMASFLANREDAQWDKDFKTMQFKASREDEEWNRSFKMAQFKADQAQRAFSNSMQQAQLRISQANAAYNRQIAQAKAKQAAAQNQAVMMQADFQVGYAEFLQKVEKWRKQGGTDYDLASYFNVPLNVDVTSQYGNRIEQGIYNWNQKAEQLAAYAKSTGDAQLYLNVIQSFQEESKPVDYGVAYNDTLTQVAQARQTGLSYGDILNGVLADSASYKNYLGTSGYNKLLTDLNRQADQER